MADPLAHGELSERLHAKVLGPEGQGAKAFLFDEVQLGGRRVDHLSVGIWSSFGRELQGYEVKASRRDWLNEVKDHSKSEGAFTLCERFWLVTNPGVVHPGELPEEWGLMLSAGRRRHLKIEKPAPKLTRGEIDYDLIVAMLRRALQSGRAESEERREQLEAEYQDHRAKAAESIGVEIEDLNRTIDRLRNQITELNQERNDFCEAAGIRSWELQKADARQLGAIYKGLREGNLHRLDRQVETMIKATAEVAESLESTRELINQTTDPEGGM